MKVIAESAFNHNGSIEYLLKLAEVSKLSDADFFTFQVMDINEFCLKQYSKHQLYLDCQILKNEWIELFNFCKRINLNIIPCVLDENSFDLCYNFGFRIFKIHATDICNEPFLNYMVSKGNCRFFLETQVATNFDIKFANNILGDNIECIITGYSNYPTEVEDLNLSVIETLKNEYRVKIGFADHSIEVNTIPLMLLAKGCDYIEKHITITRNNRNFDWQVSLYPEQFKSMVSNIKYYEKALGNGVKHPVKNELTYRSIIYKKVVDNKVLRRADEGDDFLTHKFKSFDRNNITIALIARLKSQRLPSKVLKPFSKDNVIIDLYNRLKLSQNCSSVYLATSYLEEDKQLANICTEKGMNVFLGHPISVIDRMLELAFKVKAGGIFRVTGDNPFTDPSIIDTMVDLFLSTELDYVRVNNVPFGISGELFSVAYLWDLYLKMDNPMNSEYLSWFVLNDKEAKKGALDFVSPQPELRRVNLSIDYIEDYNRCIDLLKKINNPNFNSITFKDIIEHCNVQDIESEDKIIKLPVGNTILFNEYLNMIDNTDYLVKRKIEI